MSSIAAASTWSARRITSIRRWREDCSSWWASAISQKYKTYEGRPLRNAARLCRALGGLPVKTPMLLSRRRRESSSVVTQDSSSSPCSSSSSSWVLSLPPLPTLLPPCDDTKKVGANEYDDIFNLLGCSWRKSSYLFERAIDGIYEIEVTF